MSVTLDAAIGKAKKKVAAAAAKKGVAISIDDIVAILGTLFQIISGCFLTPAQRAKTIKDQPNLTEIRLVLATKKHMGTKAYRENGGADVVDVLKTTIEDSTEAELAELASVQV